MSKNKKPYGLPYQKAMRAYARQLGIKNAAFRILCALLEYTNGDTGQSRPGIGRLMADTGYHRRTFDRNLPVLRKAGLIVPIAYASGGYACATVYGFPLPAWTTTTDISKGLIPDQPPTNCQTTTDKMSNYHRQNVGTNRIEQNRTEGTGCADTKSEPPSRRQEAPLRPQTPEEKAQFSIWEDEYNYSYAMGMLKRYREQQALAAE